jgi:UDP-N-acetylglucosamine--N-acetylmuramyl-(pentapeptide) pyrophosphoryl-undecaprenol N-acetylglucosamine transferase
MDQLRKFRIVLTGGGSGGHIYPLMAVVEELERLAIDEKLAMDFYYYGPKDDYSDTLRSSDIKIVPIISGKIRRYFSIKNILDFPKFFIGFFQALWKLLILMPDVIFSKGGTGALAIILAGWIYRIPIVIHESDSSPGLTNLVSSPFAKRIAVSFERAIKYFNPAKTAWLGAPVRRDFIKNRPTQKLAKEEMVFVANEPLVLVLGGSQGSQPINEFIIRNLVDLIKDTQVLHQTGQANYGDVQKLARVVLIETPLNTEIKSRYQAVPYFDKNLKTAMTAADLIIARAGSGTIFEIAAMTKPSILIPLAESANDHQRANAYEFAKTGSAVVIEQENLLPGIFLNQVREILNNKPLQEKMGAAANEFFKPQAAEIIAREIIKIAV